MPPFMSEPVERRVIRNKDEVVVENSSIIVNYMTNMGRVGTAHQYSGRLHSLEESEMVVKIILLGYTVRLLSFMTGIIKSICMKEMTLLLFSF